MTSTINNTINTFDTYTLRAATLDDAFEIWSVMDSCANAMEQKEHFICDDLDYVKDILSGHGFAVVACNIEGKIVGNLLVKYPGLEEENLGYDVFTKPYKHSIADDKNTFAETTNHSPLLSKENLMKVVHMDSASVLPKHRGNKLEARMISFAETLVDTSKYYYAFATVAPGNTASLKSLERNGYQVMVTKEKYGGLMRCVMMKELI